MNRINPLCMENLRFPIGQFKAPEKITKQHRDQWIGTIQQLPHELKVLTRHLPDEVLDMPYRPGGWTVRTVVHHIADSHTNCLIRFKWALTENNPVIKAYNEAIWATLHDYRSPIQPTLDYIEHLHFKMVCLFRGLSEEQWQRTFYHPEYNTTVRLDWNVGQYAWHGEHHIAHIRLVVKE